MKLLGQNFIMATNSMRLLSNQVNEATWFAVNLIILVIKVVRKFQNDFDKKEFQVFWKNELSTHTLLRSHELILRNVSKDTWASFISSLLVTSMMVDFLNLRKDDLEPEEVLQMKKGLSVQFQNNFDRHFHDLTRQAGGWFNFMDYADSVLREPSMIERFLSYLINFMQ